MYTEWPGIYSYEELNDRLFINPGRNDNIHETHPRPGGTLLSTLSGRDNRCSCPSTLVPSSVKSN